MITKQMVRAYLGHGEGTRTVKINGRKVSVYGSRDPLELAANQLAYETTVEGVSADATNAKKSEQIVPDRVVRKIIALLYDPQFSDSEKVGYAISLLEDE